MAIAGLFIFVGLTYAATVTLSWEMFGAGAVPAFFPAAGVTVGAMMLTRRQVWPAIAVTIFVIEMVVDICYGSTIAEAAVYAIANVIEPVVGASAALAWCRGVPDLRERADLARFLATACTLGPLIGGAVGAIGAVMRNGSPWLPAVLHWWAGDGVGAFVVGAPIILWQKQSDVLKSRRVEAGLGLLVVAGLSLTAFWAQVPPSAVLLPLMIWAAFRLSVVGAALAGAVVAFASNFLTQTQWAPLGGLQLSSAGRLAMTQVFIAVIVFVGFVIAQEIEARSAALKRVEAEQNERIRLESLARLAQQLSAALTPKQIGDAVVKQVRADAGAHALALGVISADRQTIEWVGYAGYPPPVAARFGSSIPLDISTAVTDAIHRNEPVPIRTPAEYANLYPRSEDWMTVCGASSALTWPLKAAGKQLGVLGLMWTQPQPLDAGQLAYVSAIATMIEQALERARRYATEHARSAVLQSAVLPTRPVNVPGLDFGVVYEPADVAQGLGGDWYDATPLPSNRTYLAVGDVVGHGLAAVEDMAQLRSAGLAMALQGLSPAQLLGELNTVARHATHGKFATMMAAVWNPVRGTISYSAAGHPPGFLRRFTTGEVIELGAGRGPVLGPIEDAHYEEDEIAIEPGDILVMYTDGLIERPGRDVDEGMLLVQKDIAGWQGDVVLSDACRNIAEMLAPAPRHDDVCVIAVRARSDASAAN
jgi:serine phosphatase RsbU (regulator of sigma subunit)/integral membrane sensor domain MASE1